MTIPGYVFDKWSVPESKRITSETVIYAEYQQDESQTAAVSVINGITDNSETSRVFQYNDPVTVVPNPEAEGLHFAYWTRDGNIISHDYTYRFHAWGDTTVEAVFTEDDIIPVPRAVMDRNVKHLGSHAAFMAERTVPEGHSLVEFGILISESLGELTLEGCDYKAVSATVSPNGQFTARIEAEGKVWYARAYLIYEKDGEHKIVYSNIVNN